MEIDSPMTKDMQLNMSCFNNRFSVLSAKIGLLKKTSKKVIYTVNHFTIIETFRQWTSLSKIQIVM